MSRGQAGQWLQCFAHLFMVLSREDLKDTPLDDPDMEIFTDGSSFVRDGKRKAGYAMVTAEQVLEAKSLPQGTRAQLAEPVALTRTLELSKGQRVNIYTDSKYTYLILHAHAAIWKEKKDSLKQQQENLLSISERSRDF